MAPNLFAPLGLVQEPFFFFLLLLLLANVGLHLQKNSSVDILSL